MAEPTRHNPPLTRPVMPLRRRGPLRIPFRNPRPKGRCPSRHPTRSWRFPGHDRASLRIVARWASGTGRRAIIDARHVEGLGRAPNIRRACSRWGYPHRSPPRRLMSVLRPPLASWVQQPAGPGLSGIWMFCVRSIFSDTGTTECAPGHRKDPGPFNCGTRYPRVSSVSSSHCTKGRRIVSGRNHSSDHSDK